MTLSWTTPERPYAIAHRGASAYAPESSFRAFEIAAELGAEFWEVDIRLSADNQLLVFHDAELPDGRAIVSLSYAQIIAASTSHIAAPLLSDVLELAQKHGAGIYADIKDNAAAVPAYEALKTYGIEKAIIGAFDPEAAHLLLQAGCTYPRSALVPIGADPFEHSKGADIIHLCWEHMERPQDLLDDAFFERAKQNNQLVALWHEEDPRRMAALRHLPVLGICSDRPELVNPYAPPTDWPVKIVCHRGANQYAPENTLEAAHCAFAAGFTHVEIDVHSTLDGELVVIHDHTLDRTTNGSGLIAYKKSTALKQLDAGSWFSPKFMDQKIPTLAEILNIAELYEGALYIELKTAAVKPIFDLVNASGMLDRSFFWSFDASLLRQLRALSEDVRIMIRRQDFDTLDEVFGFLSPSIIEYTFEQDWSEFDTCKDKGIAVMLAYMGSDEGKMQAIIDARPDLVNLDKPFLFRNIMQRAFAC